MNYQEALQLATEKHKGQKRKMRDKEYITHPIAVASHFISDPYRIVAVLNDTIEDTDLTLEDLRNHGLEDELIIAVDILTHKKGQTYLDYILLCGKDEMTRQIKIADLKHNLSDNPTSKCAEDRYIMALYILNDIEDTTC